MNILLYSVFVWSIYCVCDNQRNVVSSFLINNNSGNNFRTHQSFIVAKTIDALRQQQEQQQPQNHLSCQSTIVSSTSKASSFVLRFAATEITAAESNNSNAAASDLGSLQKLFSKYCDTEGLMTKEVALQVPVISDLIADDNLRPEEFDDVWNRVPKFPETIYVDDNVKGIVERIDVDSWVQLYRDIDDLFEDVGEEDVGKISTSLVSESISNNNNVAQVQKMDESNGDNTLTAPDDNSENDFVSPDRQELESVFATICDESGMIAREVLYEWDEITDLVSEGLLGKDELDEIWESVPKSTKNQLNLDGFLNFNLALDNLFDFEDDDDDSDDDEVIANDDSENAIMNKKSIKSSVQAGTAFVPQMVQGEDLDPSILFVALSNKNGLVGRDELKVWSELQEMLSVGDLLPSELDSMFASAVNTSSKKDVKMLDENSFTSLYQAINNLFESDELPDEANDEVNDTLGNLQKELLNAIENIKDEDKLSCGLDSDDTERKIILSIVDDLENDTGNLIRQRNGAIEPNDLVGDWELLYSSSSAMKFNKGLSGLGGSFPNGKFDTLVQKLKASKYVMDVEYIEHIKVVPSTASFDVTVTGSWDLRSSVSLFTGEPSIVMTVEPDRVSYGPTSTRGDHWKSLGPMNMLDISYLDDSLRIMRGNTSIETVFIFVRKS